MRSPIRLLFTLPYPLPVFIYSPCSKRIKGGFAGDTFWVRFNFFVCMFCLPLEILKELTLRFRISLTVTAVVSQYFS
jgi:hypothetical protein